LSDIYKLEDEKLLAISLMRTGAKKKPSYRIVVKEKRSKRDGAYLENLGTYSPTRPSADIKLDLDRARYWISKGAQPTQTVDRLIKVTEKAQAAAALTTASV
jgi:small subunit ribosomal protein S16